MRRADVIEARIGELVCNTADDLLVRPSQENSDVRPSVARLTREDRARGWRLLS
jgi:hypothetical protein